MFKLPLRRLLPYIYLLLILTGCFHASSSNVDQTGDTELESELDNSGAENEEENPEAEVIDEVVSPFGDVVLLSNGYKAVKNENLWGITNSINEIVIKPQFESIEETNDGLIVNKASIQWRLHIEARKLELLPSLERLTKLADGNLLAKQEDNFILFKLDGTILEKFTYRDMRPVYRNSLEQHEIGSSFIVFETCTTANRTNECYGSTGLESLKTGVVDTSGKVLLEPSYCKVKPLSSEFFFVKDCDNKSYIVDNSGNSIHADIDDVYNFVFNKGFIADIGKDIYFLGKDGKTRKKLNLDSVFLIGDGYAVIRKGELFGFVNAKGDIVVEPKYLQVRKFSGGHAAVRTDQGWGFIDTSGNEVIAPQFDIGFPLAPRLGEFVNGYAVIGSDWKKAILDKEGKEVVSDRHFHPFSMRLGSWFPEDGVAVIEGARDKQGVSRNVDGISDLYGNVILEPQFEYIGHFDGGVASFKQDQYGPEGLIDKNGTVLANNYESVGTPSDGRVSFAISGPNSRKMGYLDYGGNEIIDPLFLSAFTFRNGIALVEVEGNFYGLIDINGYTILPAEYEYIELPAADKQIFGVKKNGKYGAIRVEPDFSTTVVVDLIYDKISHLGDGIFKVDLGEDSKLINESGLIKENVPKIILPIHESLAAYKDDTTELYGYMGTDGKVVIEPIFELARVFWSGRAQVKKNGLWGYIDSTGKVVIDIKYDMAYPFNGDTAVVSLEGNPKIISKEGSIIHDRNYISVDHNGEYYVAQFHDQNVIDSSGKKLFNEGFRTIQHIPKSEKYLVSRSRNYQKYYGYEILDKDGKKRLSLLNQDNVDRLLGGESRVLYKAIVRDNFISLEFQDCCDSKFGATDLNGNVIIPALYDDIRSIRGSNLLLAIDKNSGTYLADFNGTRRLLASKNTSIEVISDNFFHTIDSTYLHGIIDTNGENFSISVE